MENDPYAAPAFWLLLALFLAIRLSISMMHG